MGIAYYRTGLLYFYWLRRAFGEIFYRNILCVLLGNNDMDLRPYEAEAARKDYYNGSNGT